MTGVPPRMPPRFEVGDRVVVAGESRLFVVVAAPLDRTGNHVVRPLPGGTVRVVAYRALTRAGYGRARRRAAPAPGQLPIWPCTV